MNKINGFTLIELLIVVAIIGILSALIVPNFMAARERARDGQRKSDLSQVQKALELYQQDNNSSFPAAIPWGLLWQNDDQTVTYMNKVPQDPSTAEDYYYLRGVDNFTYTLAACLENVADSGNNITDCSGLTGFCTSQKCYELNEP